MKKSYKKHSPEFKEQLCQRVVYENISVAVLSRESGIDEKTLCRWLSQYRQRIDWAAGISNEREMRVMRKLRKENERLRRELTVLKKASATFVKHKK